MKVAPKYPPPGLSIPCRYLVLLVTSVFVVNILFFCYLKEQLHIEVSNRKAANDDFRTIVDYHTFDYLISKPKCVFHTDKSFETELPYFIIFVHSLATNFEQRNAIRDTWAHYDTHSKTYFLLGAVNSTRLQAEIEEEDEEFGDIIQGNFMDSPRNATYKHVMALKWFTYNCANAKYMVKMEDDVFINIPNVFNFLVNGSDSQNFLMGRYNEPRKTNRTGVRAVSEEEYAPMYFPTFADGFAVIYSNDVAARLYQKSRRMKFFWMDDVFVTGLLRLQINVAITDISNYLLNATSLAILKQKSTQLPKPDNFMFSENVSSSDQRLLWAKTEWRRMNLNLDLE